MMKKNVLTSDDVVRIQDPEQSQRRARNDGAISQDWHQPSTRSQAREANVAIGNATSASMIRTRVGDGLVTRVP